MLKNIISTLTSLPVIILLMVMVKLVTCIDSTFGILCFPDLGNENKNLKVFYYKINMTSTYKSFLKKVVHLNCYFKLYTKPHLNVASAASQWSLFLILLLTQLQINNQSLN